MENIIKEIAEKEVLHLKELGWTFDIMDILYGNVCRKLCYSNKIHPESILGKKIYEILITFFELQNGVLYLK